MTDLIRILEQMLLVLEDDHSDQLFKDILNRPPLTSPYDPWHNTT